MHLAAPDNDFALLDRFATCGDEEAFAEIVKRYAGVVYATCFRVLHDRARAEDVSQEVFFRLLRRPQAVSQSLGGWLHQCATRLALDDVRSETARRKREANRRVETAEADEQASTWQEISPYVDEAMATLPEESRELLISHFLQGKSQSAIAIETRTSPATISRRMREAVTALRAELRRQGILVAPALLIGLCRMNAPAQAATIPSTLMSELGKMAIVGKPVAAPFAWNSVSAWCDAAAKTWGWNAELVKQAVAAAASTAVAVTLTVLIVRSYMSLNPPAKNTSESLSLQEQRHLARGSAEATAPQPLATDVRVAPAGVRDPNRIVLFHKPVASDVPITLVYGDARTIELPQPLARKLIESQAGKTLEQLADESAKAR